MFVFVIKDIRIRKGFTLYKLSKLTNLSRTYLRDLENNKRFNPSLETLYKIARALGVNVKELFYTTFDINSLKRKMVRIVTAKGLDNKKVLEISQLIDLLLNIEKEEELDD